MTDEKMNWTCVPCVELDHYMQEVFDDLWSHWDNLGYYMEANDVFCPSCGKYLTEMKKNE